MTKEKPRTDPLKDELTTNAGENNEAVENAEADGNGAANINDIGVSLLHWSYRSPPPRRDRGGISLSNDTGMCASFRWFFHKKSWDGIYFSK